MQKFLGQSNLLGKTMLTGPGRIYNRVSFQTLGPFQGQLQKYFGEILHKWKTQILHSRKFHLLD